MAFTVTFPVDTGTYVITDYENVDLHKPKTLIGRLGSISCYQCVSERDEGDFIVMVSGYKDSWCQEALLSRLHIATDDEVTLYKKVMGIE